MIRSLVILLLSMATAGPLAAGAPPNLAPALKAQEDLQSQVVEGTSGGGAVKIEVTGGLNVESLKIDPEVVDADDVEMLEDLVIAALNEALLKYGMPEIFNTDQGSQFTSEEFTEVLQDHDIQISMDGKGCWRDNVFIERPWRSLK